MIPSACNAMIRKAINLILFSSSSSIGTLESLSGWKTQVVRRTGGLTQGTGTHERFVCSFSLILIHGYTSLCSIILCTFCNSVVLCDVDIVLCSHFYYECFFYSSLLLLLFLFLSFPFSGT